MDGVLKRFKSNGFNCSISPLKEESSMVVRCHGDSCACTASLNGCVWAVSRAFLLHVLLDVEFHVKSCGRLLTWGGVLKTRNNLGAGLCQEG